MNYHPQTLRNARAFLDRVQTQGVAEARELARCAELLELIAIGEVFRVVEVEPENLPQDADRLPDGAAVGEPDVAETSQRA
jgi:hypothetical protein